MNFLDQIIIKYSINNNWVIVVYLIINFKIKLENLFQIGCILIKLTIFSIILTRHWINPLGNLIKFFPRNINIKNSSHIKRTIFHFKINQMFYKVINYGNKWSISLPSLLKLQLKLINLISKQLWNLWIFFGHLDRIQQPMSII
jgi:hypothetical protein